MQMLAVLALCEPNSRCEIPSVKRMNFKQTQGEHPQQRQHFNYTCLSRIVVNRKCVQNCKPSLSIQYLHKLTSAQTVYDYS